MYIARTHSQGSGTNPVSPKADVDQTADGDAPEIPMPEALAFTPNHMWLFLGDRQTCHVGVDAFFSRALGRLDEISFPRPLESPRPVVRFKVNGVDFDLTFPNVMQVQETNTHLANHPSDVLQDPYGKGWIFEGIPVSSWSQPDQHPLEKGLLRGGEARTWMREEMDRLDSFVHEQLKRHHKGEQVLMQDGGQALGHLSETLDSAGLVRLHREFFSLHNGRRGS
jgi:glycine cleavage system H lipoate-binding protein